MRSTGHWRTRWQDHLMGEFAIEPALAVLTFTSCHVVHAWRKSYGTSPKVFRITASSNLPRCSSPLREKATAPAMAAWRDMASARRIAPLRSDTPSPGSEPNRDPSE
jgi:hypothetical protein